MKGTPAPRKELKRLERCGSVEAGIIIAIMSTAHRFPEMGLWRKSRVLSPDSRSCAKGLRQRSVDRLALGRPPFNQLVAEFESRSMSNEEKEKGGTTPD